MKPINQVPKGCSPLSSSCVIWDGPDIECIKLCQGDTVTYVVYTLAKELCTIMEQLKIDNYDLKCLPVDKCKPTDFKGLIQLIINKVCALDAAGGIGGLGTSTADTNPNSIASSFDSVASDDGCPNCIVQMAECFYYNNPANNDLVTTNLLHNYVKLIGVTVCNLVKQIELQQAGLSNLAERLALQEARDFPTYQLPTLFPVCVSNPTVAVSLDQLAAATESKVCEMLSAIGTPNEVYAVINAGDIMSIGAQDALGTTGGKVASLPNWNTIPENIAQSLQNAYELIMDLRSAVANLQATCCNTTCNDIEIAFSAAMAGPSSIKLFFAGNIPANFTNCTAEGSIFRIQDTSGNYINQVINVAGNMNNAGGVTINITGSPLNVSQNFLVTATACFTDPETGTVCQRTLTYTIVNTLDCPVMTYTPSATSIAYSFTNIYTNMTYTVEVYNASNELVQVQSISAPNAGDLSGQFNDLVPNTIYKIRVIMDNGTLQKECPFTSLTTFTNPCPPVSSIIVEFSIP